MNSRQINPETKNFSDSVNEELMAEHDTNDSPQNIQFTN